jgi:hypothetical protein
MGLRTRTGQGFLHIVQYQVHQAIVAFECANDCIHFSFGASQLQYLATRTFTAAIELYVDLLVHVFGKVHDVFLLRTLLPTCSSGVPSTTSAPAPAITAASPTEPAPVSHNAGNLEG